jgi:rare lipoprotein A
MRVVAIGGGLLCFCGQPAVAVDASSPAFGTAAVLDADIPGLHGEASFYGQGFKGRLTASGERFDPRRFTAASNRFPLGARLAVLRPDNGRCALVVVNDRMHRKHRRRIVDVSRGVAEFLGMLRAGVVMVRVAALPEDFDGQGEDACHAVFAAAACSDCLPPDDRPD